MERRTFFKWMGSATLPFVMPAWVRARLDPFASGGTATLRAVAAVVLPASLGATGLDAAISQFTEWVRNYRAGAEMSSGYGFTRIRVEPSDPSAHYAEQLRHLESAARAQGVRFAELSTTARRAIVQSALADAGADGMPRRPNGRHVATDLMAFFFFISSDGHDFLYNAAIKRDECRGLKSSGQRPAPLS